MELHGKILSREHWLLICGNLMCDATFLSPVTQSLGMEIGLLQFASQFKKNILNTKILV